MSPEINFFIKYCGVPVISFIIISLDLILGIILDEIIKDEIKKVKMELIVNDICMTILFINMVYIVAIVLKNEYY